MCCDTLTKTTSMRWEARFSNKQKLKGQFHKRILLINWIKCFMEICPKFPGLEIQPTMVKQNNER